MHRVPRITTFLFVCFLLLVSVACTEEEPTPTPAPTPSPTAAPTLTPSPVPTDTPLPAPTSALFGDFSGLGSARPRVVGRTPEIGQEVGLDGEFELYFDQPMDQEKTAAAFKVVDTAGNTIGGTVSWPESRILRFKPAEGLLPGAVYDIVIDPSAASELGEPLLEGLTIPFSTIGNIEVSQVSPAADTTEVGLETAVTVIFNRPVVPLLTYEEQAKLANPLIISPEVAGSGEWLNTSTYIWRPESSFVDRTTYTVQVSAEVVNELSPTGAQLAADYSWNFSTASPTIGYLNLIGTGRSPYDGYQHLRLDQGFEVTFNQPMNAEQTESVITFATESGLVDLEFKWNETNSSVMFTPTQLLELSTQYLLTVPDTALSAAGGTLRQGLTWSATTVLRPAVTSTEPTDGFVQDEFSSVFTIYFASPMDRDSFEGKVIFDPPTTADPNGLYNSWEWSNRYFGLQPSTDYTVTILPGMKDPYGNETTETITLSFRTAPYSPSAALRMIDTFALYRQGGSLNIWSSYRNVSQLDTALYRLDPSSFAQLARPYYSNPLDHTPPAANLVWSQSVDVSGDVDVRAYKNFELVARDGQPLAPGFYFVTLNSPQVEPYYKHLDARPLLLANTNLVLKTTTTEAMVWATDLTTGVPLPNVAIILYDNAFNKVASGITDANGLVYMDGLTLSADWDSSYYALTDSAEHFGAAISSWDQGVSPYDFGVYTNYYNQPGNESVYIYTDRPLYRPGHTVYFKGVLRANDDLDYSIPPRETVYVSIYSYDGLVLEEELTLSNYGTFVGELALDDEAILGNYSINISTAKDGDYLGGGYFDVAEYRKPTYQVQVTSPEEGVIQGSEVQLTVDAEYFSGGSVAGSDVSWYASSSQYFFNPTENLRPYSFSTQEYDRYSYYSSFYDYGNSLGSGEGVTNGRGEYSWSLPAELNQETPGSRLYSVEATVTDIGGNAVSGRTQVIVHASEVYAGIKSSQYIGEAGEALGFDLILVDWEGNPIPNGQVDVEIMERKWSSIQEEDEYGNTIWKSSVEEIPAEAFTGVELDSDGRASVEFTPAKGGVYRAYVRATDSQGNPTYSTTYVWVSSSEYVSWRRSGDHSFDLVANANDFKPGETAEILIASPFQGESYALVTVERGHITQQEVVKLTSNSTIYRLPITGDMAPNVFVSVVVVKGVDETNLAPDFKMSYIRFNVEREEQELKIEITPDKVVLGPQDTVNYTIRVTDYAGRPVEAELSLALVDLALLTIAQPNSQPILDFFYSEQWLAVRTAVLLTQNMDAFNTELEEEIKGGGGGGGDFGVLTIRENFKDTAHWTGQITTDANGVAEVSIELPDNLTTWRLDVRAVTEDTLVGQATNDIRTTRPLLVEPQTPRFFVVEDEATVGTVVRNTTNQEMVTDVSIQAEGVVIADDTPETQQVTVPANGAVFVTWKVQVEDVSRVDFVFSAKSDEFFDASRPLLGTLEGQGIPVYKYEVDETVGTSGQLLDGDVIVESIGLPIYPNYTPTDGEVTIKVAPSLAAAMTDGLNYLQHFPYECTEQIVSKFLPNVVSTRALKAAGINDPVLEENLETQITIALQKLKARQNPDGGWGWWGGTNYRSDVLVSAYVILGLKEAQDSGYTIDERMLERGLDYLQTNKDLASVLTGRYRSNRFAFVTYVLARNDIFNNQDFTTLYNRRESLDLYARAYLGQAILLSNPNDDRLETLTADFISAANLSATGTSWGEGQRDYWNWGSNTRTTAIVMAYMAKVEPDNPVVANSVRWLMAHRTDGRWSSTQETAWVIMGLTDWMVESGELEADFNYEIAVNGALIGSGQANAETLRETVELKVDMVNLLKDELNRVAIGRTDGPGNLYYTSHLRVALPVPEINALDKGFSVTRQYYHPDDRTTPISEIEQGETVLVRLTIVIPTARYYVVVDDFLPAGLEAIDTSLVTSPQESSPPLYESAEEFYRSGWGWWYFDHTELRDERVVLSADYLPAGTYEYVYLARASTPGAYRTIPPTASEFYFPEVYGRGDGMLFTVTPRTEE